MDADTEQAGGDVARRAALSAVLRSNDFQPLSSTVTVDIAARSLRGRNQTVNQDNYLVVEVGRHQQTLATSLAKSDVQKQFDEHAYAMLLADGLGEGGSGSVASRIALSTVAHMALLFGHWNIRVDRLTASEIEDRAEWFAQEAGRAVYSRALTNPQLKGMAATLTAAYSAGDTLFVAHVGHSRMYLFRDGDLSRVTRDDTIEQQRLDDMVPTGHGRTLRDAQHILTDTLGWTANGPYVDVRHVHLLNGDCVLLCTNGLFDAVDESIIAETLAVRRGANEQCEALIERASAARAEDNTTVIIAEYEIPVAEAPTF